ncbi:MAG: ribose 5-phosphate isomerase B [candidate division WOR-3 bacterium]|nr:MAG: ribose 5-phosphate isomerase B [candidate division WOR-3 bacterium]
MKVAIGADHRGFKTKSFITTYLKRRGIEVLDHGTLSEEPVDYPDIAWHVGTSVALKRVKFGILLCYSGQGMVMAANKVKGVRAALCVDKIGARLSRAHNDANVLVLPAGFMPYGRKMREIINTFLTAKFERGRHLRRVRKMEEHQKSRAMLSRP